MKLGVIRRDDDVSRAMWAALPSEMRFLMAGLGLVSSADLDELAAKDVRRLEREFAEEGRR